MSEKTPDAKNSAQGSIARVHSFPNGTVAVKMHKTRRLTLVVAREELDEVLISRVEFLEHENRLLKRKLSAVRAVERSIADE